LKSIVPPIEPLPVPFAFGPLTKVEVGRFASTDSRCVADKLRVVDDRLGNGHGAAKLGAAPNAAACCSSPRGRGGAARDGRCAHRAHRRRTIDGERHIWWNFVSSSNARIEQAKRDWKEGRFPKVPGDEIESIPLPE